MPYYQAMQHRLAQQFWMVVLLVITYTSFTIMATVETVSAPLLFGDREVAFLDLWSIQHMLSGTVMAWGLSEFFRSRTAKNHYPRTTNPLVITLAYGWEWLEFTIETGRFGSAGATWMKGIEHWSNHLVADPALVLTGALLYRFYPPTRFPALIFVLVWGLTNVLLPNSMSLQELLLG